MAKYHYRSMKFIPWLLYVISNRSMMYNIKDLVVGGHCGLCGKWCGEVIVEEGWRHTVCDECKRG